MVNLVQKKSQRDKIILQIGSDSQGNPPYPSTNVATEIV